MVKQLMTEVVLHYPYHQMEVKLLLGLFKMMEMEMVLVMYVFLAPLMLFAPNHLTLPLPKAPYWVTPPYFLPVIATIGMALI